MAIKNWIVTVESARSILARELYLNNKKHPNHKNTESIISIIGNEQTSLNINHQCEKYKLKMAMNRKGGRPPTPAMEYVYTLPKGIIPTPNEWRQMIEQVVINMAHCMKVKPSDLNGIVRAVVHQQNQNNDKGSGNHAHVLIGRYTNTGIYLRELQKKSVLHVAKISFNSAVLKTLGIDHQKYIAQKEYHGLAKNKAPKWKVDAARNKELEVERLKQYQRIFVKVLKQCEKWLIAFEQGDVKQLNRQYNRINKELTKIDFENGKFIYKPAIEIAHLIDKLTLSIDKKSKRAQLPKLITKSTRLK
ncbi:hypothetical protein ACEI25_003423 [Photobacterium damselae]